jgi:hypothetical protein|tara:strand:- start:141 stop:281 length:141 start_codon:yes stop_codon:yes gene_type:complete
MKLTVVKQLYRTGMAAHLHKHVVVLEIKDNVAAWGLLEYYGMQLDD